MNLTCEIDSLVEMSERADQGVKDLKDDLETLTEDFEAQRKETNETSDAVVSYIEMANLAFASIKKDIADLHLMVKTLASSQSTILYLLQGRDNPNWATATYQTTKDLHNLLSEVIKT